MPSSMLDRRSTTELPEPAPDETKRMATRRHLKLEIARRGMLATKVTALQERVAKLDREADDAADQHRAATAEAQIELNELDEQFIAATADRVPIPDGCEARRRELFDVIHAANEKLSDAVDRIKRLRQPIAAEICELRSQIGQAAALENQLVHKDVANPKLLSALFVAGEASNWAATRLKAAEQHVRENEQLAAAEERRGDQQREAYYRGRNAKWKAEIEAAGDAYVAAEKISAAARAAVIDE